MRSMACLDLNLAHYQEKKFTFGIKRRLSTIIAASGSVRRSSLEAPVLTGRYFSDDVQLAFIDYTFI